MPVDRNPDIRAAGKAPPKTDESVSKCFNYNDGGDCGREKFPLGTRRLVPGSENVDANQVFGVKNDYGSGSAAAVLNPTDTKHPAVEAAEARRGNPKSRLNHPMGQPRPFEEPAGFDRDKRFGVTSVFDGSTKECMDYADAEVGDLPDHIRESLRVQPAPQAGEQKRRPHKEDLYTPGKTFGKATPSYKDGRGTRDTLKWGADDETPTTQHRADFSHGSLDKTQLASRTARVRGDLPSDHTFGQKNDHNGPSAGDVIGTWEGGVQELDSRPQDDRVFGMPTLRKDKRPPAVRSVSDRTNYGDDGDAKLLLSPSIFTAHAVDPSTPLGRAEIKRLCNAIDIELSEEEFEEIWAAASEGGDPDKVSFDRFRAAGNL